MRNEKKRNWLQMLSLALICVLLVMVIQQKQQIEGLYDHIANSERGLESRISDVSHALSSAMEMSELVESHLVSPKGLDKETKSLLAEVFVTLRSYRADTKVALQVAEGQERREVPMEQTASGEFFAVIALPTAEDTEIRLDLAVDNGGLVTRESLAGYGSVAMLLPVQVSGWSGGTVGTGGGYSSPTLT